MNFNYILVGITLLISLITLYTIYNVNNKMDKLLDTDTDDGDGNTQRLSIIKYTKENNLKLNSLEDIKEYSKVNISKLKELEGMIDKQYPASRTIINMLTSMMKYIEFNLGAQNKTQVDIKNDIDNLRDNFKFYEGKRREDAKVQRNLLEHIAQGLGGVPRDTTTRMITRSPVARRAF